MKKSLFFKSFKNWYLLPLVCIAFLVACGDDDPIVTEDDPIASFQFAISETNFLEVTFTNFSQNASSYMWDFGDGNNSADENPTHTYSDEGTYTVTLTASNAEGTSANRSETIAITDPNQQLSMLAGQTSKTWYLQREGIALGIGPAMGDNGWWSFGGVTPLAERPCILDDSYTFHRDGTWEFNSGGTFFVDAVVNGGWAIDGVDEERCVDESESGAWGDDSSRSDFGSGGDYTFVLDNATGVITVNGSGNYIGLPVKTNAGDNNLPVQFKDYTIGNLVSGDIADTLAISLLGDGFSWNFNMVSYHDPADLPEIPTDIPEFGEDLPDMSPATMFRLFASNDASDFMLLDTIASGSTVDYGVADPADAMAMAVGQFNRTDAQFQELQFQTSPDKFDINFENLTTVSIDVYLPSANDYSGALTTGVIIGLADRSQTQQWWTDQTEYIDDGSTIPLDTWTTITFNLDSPSYVAQPDTAANPYERNDYDMIYVNIGGSNHTDTGTFYVRNLRFE